VRVISDSSPLIALSRIGQLSLLRELYQDVTVPQGVVQEVVGNGAGQPGAEEVSTADWIIVVRVKDQPFVESLRRDLGEGEAEAIALAVELQADLLIVDDLLARQAARNFGLMFVGTVGVLLEARQKGLLPEIKPALDDLIDLAGFRLSGQLYARVLREAGEDSASMS
jgi:predicted nucleic acid-binding protein